MRYVLDKYLREQRLSPIIAMEVASSEAIKSSVMADMGIALLSLHAVATELRHGLLQRIDFEGTPSCEPGTSCTRPPSFHPQPKPFDITYWNRRETWLSGSVMAS